jgi:hypothetical protein
LRPIIGLEEGVSPIDGRRMVVTEASSTGPILSQANLCWPLLCARPYDPQPTELAIEAAAL